METVAQATKSTNAEAEGSVGCWPATASVAEEMKNQSSNSRSHSESESQFQSRLQAGNSSTVHDRDGDGDGDGNVERRRVMWMMQQQQSVCRMQHSDMDTVHGIFIPQQQEQEDDDETASASASASAALLHHETEFSDIPADPATIDDGVSTAPLDQDTSRSIVAEKQKKNTKLKYAGNTIEGGNKPGNLLKALPKFKGDPTFEAGQETEVDMQYSSSPLTWEGRIKSLKASLVHAARKMPKNAHVYFILGLMYQRSGQTAKAVTAFEKSFEIIKQFEEETGQTRKQLHSLVQTHQALCLLQGSMGDNSSSFKELTDDEIRCITCKVKESVQSDNRQAAMWNSLGFLLLKSGCVQSAISILLSILAVVPDNLDTLSNLGVAYLHSGQVDAAACCFQSVLLKDKNHPASLINYGVILLCKYGSYTAGSGARINSGAYSTQVEVAKVAQSCFASAIKVDPRAGHLWANLALACSLHGDYTNTWRYLEQAAKFESNRVSIRYAIAMHRVKDAQLFQNPTLQLSVAAYEMASILRETDLSIVEPCLAWGGLALVEKEQHESAAAFEEGEIDLKSLEERTLYTLQQAIEEDPSDAVHWHQLGLHTLCKMQFKDAQNYFKTAITLQNSCSSAWSNLGITLQLSEELSQAEDVYKKALSIAATDQMHAILSNLGNLYRQQQRFADAYQVFSKALEICPSYAPACNNLGLLYVVQGNWQNAISYFDKALLADQLLDVAKSNKIKALALCHNTIDTASPIAENLRYPFKQVSENTSNVMIMAKNCNDSD